MAKAKKIAKVKSLSELWMKVAKENNADYQKLVIVALENLGCEHLANKRWHPVKWEAYFNGLNRYWESLVNEYGEREDKAEKSLIAEINNVRDCIDQANLDW